MANLGTIEAKLLVQMAGDPIELGTFHIPLDACADIFGRGIGEIRVDPAKLREEIALAMHLGADKLINPDPVQ
jgi:hypothetical protein